jgi:hypothetical protein
MQAEAMNPMQKAEKLEVTAYGSAQELPSDVQQLLEVHERTTLQFGLAWWRNLEAHVFAGHPGKTYFVLRAEGNAIALLPLLITGQALNKRATALANYYTCLYEPALLPGLDAITLVPLFRAVRRHQGGVHTLTLAPMNPDGQAFGLIEQALALAGFATRRYFCFGNWYLQPPATYAEYFAAREGKLRSTVKRMTQKLSAEKADIEILSQPEDLERGIAAYQAVYAKSWKVPEPSAEFMPGLIRLCAEAGALRLGVVWLNGQPIAAQVWIVSHGRAEIYKLAYDEAYKAYSPGSVLTAKLMAHVIERDQVSEIDYLIGDDAYKKSLMSHRRERWGLVARNHASVVGNILWVNDRIKAWLKPLISRYRE